MGTELIYFRHEVEELVNHLESKIVIWHSSDEIPELVDNFTSKLLVFITNTGYVYTGNYISNKDEFKFYLRSYPRKEIKKWCYMNDLLKTIG